MSERPLSKNELRQLLELATEPASAAREPETFNADQLRTMTFPPLNYLLPGLIPEGCVLIVSKPKLGKSWLVLDLAIGTAAGRFVLGDLKPAHGAVLYLALEDGKRRLQRRLGKLLPTFIGDWPTNLTFATEWQRANEGGVAAIERWIENTKAADGNPRLVIVDTLAQFRKRSAGKDHYQEDNDAIAELRKLASKHGITIAVVHHDRKSEAEDVFDTVSGTLGLTGAADTIAILKRQNGAITLHIRGRDVEESEKALRFDKATCRWTILGDAYDVRLSDERASVLRALEGAGRALGVSEIMAQANLTTRMAADKLLGRRAADGQIERVRQGVYDLPDRDRDSTDRCQKVRSETKAKQNQRQKKNGIGHYLTPSDTPSTATEEYLGPG
jgi:AAA domain